MWKDVHWYISNCRSIMVSSLKIPATQLATKSKYLIVGIAWIGLTELTARMLAFDLFCVDFSQVQTYVKRDITHSRF